MSWRVGLVVVLSAALGSLAAAAVAIIAVDRLIAHQADQRLLAATVTLGGELDEEAGEKRRAGLKETVDDENGEIATSGIRLAVVEHGRLLAGDSWMRPPLSGDCETRRVSAARVRFCATPYEDGWTLVAAQAVDASWLYFRYALAVIGAVALGGAAGALSSTVLSRWAVRPLEALSRALRRSRAEAPGALELPEATGYDEVEAIRAALLDLGARLQLLLDQAHRFAADAAHELRTPLTVLRTELELLVEEAPATERSGLERACARVIRLSALIERLLVLALPADNLRAGFEALSLADLVQEVTRDLPPDDRGRVQLTLNGEGLLRGDPRLLGSLVSNGVQNALKFAPEGTIEVCVTDSEPHTAGAPEVILEIRDGGAGVPAELRERVFEPFFRARPTAAAGQGLGLALIGHIARAHGGHARFADSEVGARLVVALPGWTERAPARPMP